MKIGRHKLDLPQAIVVSVVLGSIIVALGLVLTWGPEDRAAQVSEWVAMGVAGIGSLYTAVRARGLISPHNEEEEE